jgi:hypothetical protein
MALVALERTTPLGPVEAWERLVDWERHGAFVPCTRLTVTTAPPVGRGTRLVARTAIGGLGVDDPMEIVEWVPPQEDRAGHCRLEKRGTWVRGWAEIHVRPDPRGSRVSWGEEIRVRGVPSWGDPLLAAAGRSMFGRTVNGLLRGRR